MYVSFNQLSDEARIWIYQANRPLVDQEKEKMLQRVQVFLAQWASHGNSLQCSAEMFYNQFLVLAVEERIQGATGCAVDASVQFIRELEQVFQVALLDRTHIAFRCSNTNFVIPLGQLKTAIQKGDIRADMLTFDNTITKKEALTDRWLVPVKDSWVGKYFDSQ